MKGLLRNNEFYKTINTMLIRKFRYDFTEEIGKILKDFSDEHESETGKEFQKSWNIWIMSDEIKKQLKEECDRLLNEGYNEDVWDKMYKSARYYYKKKTKKEKVVKEKIKHTNRFSTIFLKTMDDSIKNQLKHEIEEKNEITISQPKSYTDFCNSNKDNLLNEFKRIRQEKGQIPDDIDVKLRKTYKNRFHALRKKIVENDT